MADETEPEFSTRRGLLRALTRTAKRRAREGASALGPGAFAGRLGPDASPDDVAAYATLRSASATPVRRPARRPASTASLDELLSLAHEVDLTRRDDDLGGLALRSLRMTPVDRAHADAWILTREEWIAAGDDVLLAVIKLDAAPDTALPGNGWLAVFVKPDPTADSEVWPAHGVVLEHSATIPPGAEPVAFSPELVLPRRWHELVQALELDDAEGDAYDRLRERLQLAQGTETDADGGSDTAYHRLLGYPNETTGTMPSECARALSAASVADGLAPESVNPGLPSREWRLLMQISIGERRRVYLWIRQRELDAREFGQLCAFVR